MSLTSTPNVILSGGPAENFPEAARIRSAPLSETTVKVLHGNRYEHFSRTPDTITHELGELSVFTWTGSTYVAE